MVTPACACSKEGITHKCYLSNQILAVVTPILRSSPRGDQRVDPDAGLRLELKSQLYLLNTNTTEHMKLSETLQAARPTGPHITCCLQPDCIIV